MEQNLSTLIDLAEEVNLPNEEEINSSLASW